MGIAIIWVALYHMTCHNSLPVLGFLQDVGYGGVDIFVFISGFGVYYSLKKNPDAFSFLSKRLGRLLPSYLPFILVWMVVRFVTYQLYLTEVCGNLTMTGWWNGDANQFNWYVDGILLFYILAPYIYGALNKNRKLDIVVAPALIGLAFIVSLAFLHGQLLMAMSRLPLFIMGMVLAWSSYKLLDGKALCIAIWNVAMLFGFLVLYYLLRMQDAIDKWHYGLWWYPFIMIVPGLVLDLGLLGDVLSKAKGVYGFIEQLGCASFEIFLWHLFIFETAQSKNVEGVGIWIVLFIVAMLAGYGYYRLINFCIKKVRDR